MHKTDNVGWTMRHNDNGSSCGVCRLLSVESQIVCRVPFLAGRDTKFWFVSYALLYVPRVVCLFDGLGGTLFRWWRCQCQWPARSSVIDWPSLFGCHTQDMHEIFFLYYFCFHIGRRWQHFVPVVGWPIRDGSYHHWSLWPHVTICLPGLFSVFQLTFLSWRQQMSRKAT